MGKSKGVIGTIITLLLIIPIAFGIYYGGQYLLGDLSSSDNSNDVLNQVDIYVNGTKVQEHEYTFLLPSVGDSVLVDFKKEASVEFYDKKIIFTPNYDASQYLSITDNFDTGQFVQTKVTLLGKTNSAQVIFSDESYSFNFTLKIICEYTQVTTINVPDITFWN